MDHMLRIVFLCLMKLAASSTFVHISPDSSLVGVQITVAYLLMTSHRRYNCHRKKCSVFFDTPKFFVSGPAAELSIRKIIGPFTPVPTLTEQRSLSSDLMNCTRLPANKASNSELNFRGTVANHLD